MKEFSQYTDEALLALMAGGNENAFTEIFQRYWEKLFYIAHKRLQSEDDAKEIVQNVFLALWEKRQTLQIQVLPVYLAAMVRYAVYRHWANLQTRNAHLKIAADHAPLAAAEFDLENKQFLEILAKFADTLPEKYRLVFITHKLLDRPLEEVAAQLGVSPRTAERYVAKVMDMMRSHKEKIAFSLLLSLFF